MASKLTLWINQKLKDKGMSAKDAQKDAGKYKSIAAAKKAGSLYYTDKNGKVKIAAYAEDLKNVGKKEETKGISYDPMFSTIKVTELEDKELMTQGRSRRGSEAIGKAPTEKRDPSKRIQALKGVSNAKLASRIRAKLNDPSFKKSNRLSSLKQRLKSIMKINASTKGGERAQKMALDVLLRRVDEMIMNKGGVVKKKMNMGGLTGRKVNPSTGLAMNLGGLTKRKINPSTGLAMNKGGMTDYRKSGMFKK